MLYFLVHVARFHLFFLVKTTPVDWVGEAAAKQMNCNSQLKENEYLGLMKMEDGEQASMNNKRLTNNFSQLIPLNELVQFG